MHSHCLRLSFNALFPRWFIDDELVPGNLGTELRIPKLSRDHNNKIVKCEVNNEVGKSEETETLKVNCEAQTNK